MRMLIRERLTHVHARGVRAGLAECLALAPLPHGVKHDLVVHARVVVVVRHPNTKGVHPVDVVILDHNPNRADLRGHCTTEQHPLGRRVVGRGRGPAVVDIVVVDCRAACLECGGIAARDHLRAGAVVGAQRARHRSS